jgi:hypothetical protein
LAVWDLGKPLDISVVSSLTHGQMGVAAGTTVAIASPWMRKHAYELFKVTHIVLAAIFLAALYQYDI